VIPILGVASVSGSAIAEPDTTVTGDPRMGSPSTLREMASAWQSLPGPEQSSRGSAVPRRAAM